MDRVACPDCDLLHAAIELRGSEEGRCVRCGTLLPLPRAAYDPRAAVAYVATAAVAFAVAMSAPLMRMTDLGRSVTVTLPQSALYMWREDGTIGALIVAAFAIAFPAAHLALCLAAGIGALRTPVPRWVGVAARFARIAAPWAMPEVMLLATLVAYVKISELAPASPGLGMYATGALAVCVVLARHAADLPTLWSRIEWRGS